MTPLYMLKVYESRTGQRVGYRMLSVEGQRIGDRTQSIAGALMADYDAVRGLIECQGNNSTIHCTSLNRQLARSHTVELL